MRDNVNVHGVVIDNVTMTEAVDRLYSFLDQEKNHSIFTPNSEILMNAQRDAELRNVLNMSDMTVADGAGVVLASKILGNRLVAKVSGIDLVENLFLQTSKKEISFFFLGGKVGVAKEAKEKVANSYLGVKVVGYNDGYFSFEEEKDVIEKINSSNADVLLVGLGAPKQEKWIHKNKDKLKVKVCIGIGGALDVFAGQVKLAPDFFRRNGLEWLYRLYKEPWRFKRMLNIPQFILLSLAVRMGIRKNPKL
mgnify:CR=1 FL=1